MSSTSANYANVFQAQSQPFYHNYDKDFEGPRVTEIIHINTGLIRSFT